MKIVAAVFADFEQSFPGGRSQLHTGLGTRTVLGHTLHRLMRVAGLDARCLFVRVRDHAAAIGALRELGLDHEVDLLALDDGHRPRRRLFQAARKWSRQAWRGSPHAVTWFDEFAEPRCVAGVLDHYGCESVLCLDGHMPALDPALATAMIAHQRRHEAEARLVFTQAPPGLAGIILRRDVTRELIEQSLPVGILLNYRPEMPQGDPSTRPACLQIDPLIAQTPAVLTADTRRSHELMLAAFTELGEDVDAKSLSTWFRREGHDPAGPLPLEVELELTTDDPLPETTLRPRGGRVPRRRLADVAAVAHLAEQLAEYDDRVMVLGGHGDPLLHPRFAEVCRVIREGGISGLGVVTPLVCLSDEALAALLEYRVDLIEVQLDANSAATYRRVHNADHFGTVRANIERLQAVRQDRVSPEPLITCSMTRCAATLPELEAFFDGWIHAAGWAVVRGYNEYCGVLPADELLPLRPPIREPCRRLETRLMLLADGTVPLCAQDVTGQVALGDWFSQPLPDIWDGDRLKRVRRDQITLDLASLALCRRCGEWFRP